MLIFLWNMFIKKRQVFGLFVRFDTSVTKLFKINNLVHYQK